MEKKDRIYIFLSGIATVISACFFKFDYGKIAENGLTLSSIVLAVYIAALIGLINTGLSKKMKITPAKKNGDKSQLGVLTSYFKSAIFCSIGTIFISSLLLLANKSNVIEQNQIASYVLYITSICGLVFYIENLTFLAIITRFILNRQIWDE